MKKLCSVLLAAALAAALVLSLFAVGAVNVSAAEDCFPLISIYANPEIFGPVSQMTAYIYEKIPTCIRCVKTKCLSQIALCI